MTRREDMTRREITLATLGAHANEWVSGLALVEAGSGWRYSARIGELREAGHHIESRRSKSSAVWEFMLVVTEPAAPGQTTLFGEAA